MKRKKRFWIAVLAAAVIGYGALHEWLTWRSPMPPTQIFQGVTYSCQKLPADYAGSGLVYLVKVDLKTPGVSVYTTPLDPAATAAGWEYRLTYSRFVVDDQHLAVAVNGTLFSSIPSLPPIPFCFARGLESIVSDHHFNHAYPYDYLLCFDDRGVMSLPEDRPPTPADIAHAKWAIGSQGFSLYHGTLNRFDEKTVDHRTMLGIDSQKQLLWLACFDEASVQAAAQFLASVGAADAISMDGGHSSSMSIGPDAKNIYPGPVVGYYQPAANFLGIRALPLGN